MAVLTDKEKIELLIEALKVLNKDTDEEVRAKLRRKLGNEFDYLRQKNCGRINSPLFFFAFRNKNMPPYEEQDKGDDSMLNWIKNLIDRTDVDIIESLDNEVEQVTELLMTRVALGVLDINKANDNCWVINERS